MSEPFFTRSVPSGFVVIRMPRRYQPVSGSVGRSAVGPGSFSSRAT
jgi:hypothetical protein